MKQHTILQLGWEFPPRMIGGLGVATQGLVEGLLHYGHKIILVLPYQQTVLIQHKNLHYEHLLPISLDEIHADDIRDWHVKSSDKGDLMIDVAAIFAEAAYGASVRNFVKEYTKEVCALADKYDFDVIHAHNWMTFRAGLALRVLTKKPLVAQIHATAFDGAAGFENVSTTKYETERSGLHQSDRVVAVSHMMKQQLVDYFKVPEEKISVLHNASSFEPYTGTVKKDPSQPLVLFLARVVPQKGPEYFIETARKVLAHNPNVRFVVAGTGSMQERLIKRVGLYGLLDKVIFMGYLQREEAAQMYAMADVYVMPSVSDPFGMAVLEAMRTGTPVIVSKRAGVTEVVKHCLKVDFWDTGAMASMICSVLEHRSLSTEMGERGKKEGAAFSWNDVGRNCLDIYEKVWG